MTRLVHTVMCGGSGTRLWPWSRQSYPKQFLSLGGDRSLLQATVSRLPQAGQPVETIVIGNEEHRFLIAEQLRQVGLSAEILLEPEMRNTAPVALIAALRAQEKFGDDCLVLLAPADHIIGDASAYRAAVATAMAAARSGRVVTFGVTPDRPETGYGYIERGAPLAGIDGAESVDSFREKPDREVAEAYLASGRFCWNAGIFLFAPQVLLAAAHRLEPRMLDLCRAACAGASRDLDFLRLAREPYCDLPSISFDYAFAERLQGAMAVVPVAMGWSDIGSWQSLRLAHTGLGSRENVASGAVELIDCEGVLAMSDGPLIVAHGLEDLVVVASADAVYVGAADRSEELRKVVGELQARGRPQAISHSRTYRPWGWYQTLNVGDRYQVKEIVVYPGGRLSLQSHHHRAEHWVVVRGTARVTVDDNVRLVTENESVYIPLRSVHRLENPGRIPMHLIEIQTGSYLDEDDIVRYDDIYGRS
jgi:mannose-1-phosphate guanylyltransferase/mannose-6-phosphate isomerase